ncbi:hypothetical protein SEO_01457 [Enterococcus faecium EnGen0134]|nr:hypothetical protein OGM_00121 [Enterococcus faecium EnGen0008]ELA85512.1 hypothetical protein OI3_03389 [Enterococcus faecium EnGen0021]EOF58406.1 hypothetical protein SE3_01311 [Enterococcus faecium EnGen0124]EOF62400.1 hypothetical protein SE7_01454 [Enterococcus faecium EnGen0133]EOF65893.1 hypothetical protein SE9_01026 [Enterococcus faecium EnGen0126]EOF68189.1 hypothetical protein SEG_01088 [Enterococcus faecium EnGen0135]EOF69336.1 hypothetical protein SEU_01682 [Enterococcus faeci
MRYLSSKEIIKINAKVILRHSPGEMIGVKDANALDMAVNSLHKQYSIKNSIPKSMKKRRF